jgi:hypothetical protein
MTKAVPAPAIPPARMLLKTNIFLLFFDFETSIILVTFSFIEKFSA